MSNIYNIITELLDNAPIVIEKFIHILTTLTKNNRNDFLDKITPLLQVIALFKDQKILDTHLTQTQEKIKESTNHHTQNKIINKLSTTLFQIAKDYFTQELGLKNFPNNPSPKQTQIIHNYLKYLGNLSNKTEKDQILLSFFMAISLDGQRYKFRAGSWNIDIKKYIEPDKSPIIKKYLTKHKENNLFKHRPEKEILTMQNNTTASYFGEIQTIDIDLFNIISHAQDLLDPDIFGDNNTLVTQLYKILSQNPNLNLLLSKYIKTKKVPLFSSSAYYQTM